MSAEIPDAAVDLYFTDSSVYLQPHKRAVDGNMFVDNVAIIQVGLARPVVMGVNALQALSASFNDGLPVALDQTTESKTAQSAEHLRERVGVSDMHHLVQVARLVRLVRYGNEVDVAPTDAYDDDNNGEVTAGYVIRNQDVETFEHPPAEVLGRAILAAANRCTRNDVLSEDD
ncbi:MAG TPA: hypothetical protein VLF40_03965 [Candidatus Saccharimonadales bacterium]|nr:hypothetical protein [Candidatus Saccharimonadales bacterium]